MKKIFRISLGLMIMFLLTLPAMAQKKLNEGAVFYDITISTGSEKPRNAEFLNGAASAVYIKGGKIRTEMVNSLGTQTAIVNTVGASKEITILKEYGEQKYMINMTPADWADMNKKNENVTFSYDASATKTIQGYVAKKAIASLPDGTSFTVWYTPDITADVTYFQYANRNLPGLALEYETSLGDMKVTYTVSKISFAPVPASKFDLPKSGFRVMSYKEVKGGK
jgi:GLPGLI family protein